MLAKGEFLCYNGKCKTIHLIKLAHDCDSRREPYRSHALFLFLFLGDDMGYVKVMLGDIVQDRLTGYRGVVVEVESAGAWVEVDSADLKPYDEHRQFFADGRLIRL